VPSPEVSVILQFEGGPVDASGFRPGSEPARTTKPTEMVAATFRRCIRELDALVDFTEIGTPGRADAEAVRRLLARAVEVLPGLGRDAPAQSADCHWCGECPAPADGSCCGGEP
jgi:hypothetical protein